MRASGKLREAAARTWRRAAPLRHAIARFQATAAGLAGGPKPLRLLIVSDGLVYTSEQQFAPLIRHARFLRRRLGLVARFIGPDRAARLSRRAIAGYDIVGLKFSFRADRAASLALARKLRSAADGAGTRLFYFDGDDDLNVLRPDILTLVDRYVKKHVYSDPADYGIARIGKSNLTDHVARVDGRSFATNEIPETPPLDPALAGRIVLGWNIGLDDKIAALATRMPRPSGGRREVDICSRAVTAPESWIYPLRHPVVTALEAMDGRFRVLVPRDRVDQEAYYREMLSSTMCVSPFGYGEICWRDFEAILCGCLLVKPAMDHARTAPDIFVPGVTYVPCRWDYADLPDICERYLSDDAGRSRIVEQAYGVVAESLGEAWIATRLSAVLRA